MKANLFVPAWLEDCHEVIDAINLALASKFGVATQRGPLSRARDLLNERCARMEVDGEAECEEETYLALFDALSHLTLALSLFPVSRGQLVDAVTLLRRLRDERGNP